MPRRRLKSRRRTLTITNTGTRTTKAATNTGRVPEDECALCDAKVAAAFKKKGDWCKEHDRPDSQCFICHPEKLEEYAAKYEAKYGKKPPKPELN